MRKLFLILTIFLGAACARAASIATSTEYTSPTKSQTGYNSGVEVYAWSNGDDDAILGFYDPINGFFSSDDLAGVTNDHGSLSGLSDDDHTAYHTAARHTTAHDAAYNDALAITADPASNATLGDHAQDATLHWLRPARSLSVSKDGSGQYATIAAALTVANAAADSSNPYQIVIHPGTYAESNLSLSDYVSLSAPIPLQTIIAASDASNPILALSGNNILYGLEIQNTADSEVVTIDQASSDLVVISNCYIRGSGASGNHVVSETSSSTSGQLHIRDSRISSSDGGSCLFNNNTVSTSIPGWRIYNTNFDMIAQFDGAKAINLSEAKDTLFSGCTIFVTNSTAVGTATAFYLGANASTRPGYIDNCQITIRNTNVPETTIGIETANSADIYFTNSTIREYASLGTFTHLLAGSGTTINTASSVWDPDSSTETGTIASLEEGNAQFKTVTAETFTGSLGFAGPQAVTQDNAATDLETQALLGFYAEQEDNTDNNFATFGFKSDESAAAMAAIGAKIVDHTSASEDSEIHFGYQTGGTFGDRVVMDNTGVHFDGARGLTTADEGTGNGLDADTLDGEEATAFQDTDADLTALAALASTGIAVRTASNTWAQRSIAGTANLVSVSNGDGVSGNPTVTLVDPEVPADGTKNITGALTASGGLTGSSLTTTNGPATIQRNTFTGLTLTNTATAGTGNRAEVLYKSNDSAAASQNFASVKMDVVSTTAGAIDGRLFFQTADNGSFATKMTVGPDIVEIGSGGSFTNATATGDLGVGDYLEVLGGASIAGTTALAGVTMTGNLQGSSTTFQINNSTNNSTRLELPSNGDAYLRGRNDVAVEIGNGATAGTQNFRIEDDSATQLFLVDENGDADIAGDLTVNGVINNSVQTYTLTFDYTLGATATIATIADPCQVLSCVVICNTTKVGTLDFDIGYSGTANAILDSLAIPTTAGGQGPSTNADYGADLYDTGAFEEIDRIYPGGKTFIVTRTATGATDGAWTVYLTVATF